jgi:hypothetical protein
MPPVRILWLLRFFVSPPPRNARDRGTSFGRLGGLLSARRGVGRRSRICTKGGFVRQRLSRPASPRPNVRAPRGADRSDLSGLSFLRRLLPRATRARARAIRRKCAFRDPNPETGQTALHTSLVIGDADEGLKTAARSGTTRANRRTRQSRITRSEESTGWTDKTCEPRCGRGLHARVRPLGHTHGSRVSFRQRPRSRTIARSAPGALRIAAAAYNCGPDEPGPVGSGRRLTTA